MKRSHVLAVSTVAAAAVTLAACSSGSAHSGTGHSGSGPSGAPSSGTSTGATAASCSGTPVSGGTLVTARQNQTLSLNPHNTPGGWGDGEAMTMMYQGLVQIDPTGKTSDIVPGLADKWTLAKDGLSYTFHIRDNAKFSNGDRVTAADVKYTLDTWADPKQDQWASFAVGYKSTTVLDDHDVRIDLSEPTGDFLYELGMVAAVILPQKLVKAQGTAFFNHPVGAGPFELQSWNKGSSITFARNPNYWQGGVPRLNKVVYNFVTDDNTRVLALKGGQAEVIDFVPWSQVNSLQNGNRLAVDARTISSWILLSLNQKKPQFADLKVRQALSDAIDRSGINQKVYHGLGTTPNSFLPHLHYDAGNSTVPPFSYDLSKAKQLMSSSKFPKGFSASFEFPSGNPAFQSVAAVLQSEWAQLGVKVALHPEDQATLSKNFTGGTYDIMIPYPTAASDVPVPDEFAGFYGLPGSTHSFYSWWSAPTNIQDMIKKFVHTADDASRAAQWPKIQGAMMQQLPAQNVLDLPLLDARATNVCDFTTSQVGYDTLQTAWVGK